ncbi:retrovirus-related pol polyprotein from transposon TNT 1-94 [Tanacetum coccineum]
MICKKLSKQTESVNKEVHNKLLKSFAKLENHSISLEFALQQCKEQMKNNSVCKENGSNVFRKEREQYHEIQDLKAQMQDKNIAISELKKLIEKCKGKSVETQFDKPSVVRQPNAQWIPKPSILGKPTPFSNSLEMSSFQTKQSVNKTNVSDGLFKQVTQQNLLQNRKQAEIHSNVLKPGITLHVNVVCAKCGKCVVNSNHDACVSRYLNDVNARTKKPKVVPISTSKPKSKANKSVATHHKKTVASDTTIQKSKIAFRIYLFCEDLQGYNLLTGKSWIWILYTISLQETTSSTPICFMAKASPTQACKAKRSSFKLKAVPSSKGRLNLLHMDLYTWTLFLRSKDETPEVLKDFLTMIQRNLQAQVISVRTDRGTEFLNKTLHAYFKEEGIEHQTSTPRTPEQNGVVERRNRTLVEAASNKCSQLLSFTLSFFGLLAVATALLYQNR